MEYQGRVVPSQLEKQVLEQTPVDYMIPKCYWTKEGIQVSLNCPSTGPPNIKREQLDK